MSTYYSKAPNRKKEPPGITPRQQLYLAFLLFGHRFPELAELAYDMTLTDERIYSILNQVDKKIIEDRAKQRSSKQEEGISHGEKENGEKENEDRDGENRHSGGD